MRAPSSGRLPSSVPAASRIARELSTSRMSLKVVDALCSDPSIGHVGKSDGVVAESFETL